MKSVCLLNIAIILLLFFIGTPGQGKKPVKAGSQLQPYIDLRGSPNVNVSLGRTATLKCKTVNLIKKSVPPVFDILVSWLRHKDVNLLSVGTFLYTSDSRMSVRQDLSAGEWQLVIRDVRYSDAGQYECQINTSPVLSHTLTLSVVEPYTKILLDSGHSDSEDPATLFIDMRSVLNLTCAVFSPEIPAAIFWKHNGKLLDLGEPRYAGSIETVAGRHGSPTLSYLSLLLTRDDQSGTYECSPSNTHSDHVTVHIVQDKELPVGQSQSEQAVHQQQTVLDHRQSSQPSLSSAGVTWNLMNMIVYSLPLLFFVFS